MGIKYNQNAISRLLSPISLNIPLWKIRIVENAKALIISAIKIESTVRFAASSSFSGNTIVRSYFRFIQAEINETIDINMARIPKSSGVYILDKTGVRARGIAWAIVVPVIKVTTLITNPDLRILFM